MIRVCGLLAGLLVLAAGAEPRTGAAEPKPGVPVAAPAPAAAQTDLKIGLLEGMFKDMPESMVHAGAIPFQKMMQQKTGLKGNVTVVPNYKLLADQLSKGKLDVGVFHGFEFAWVKETPNLVPLVVTTPNCGKVQAVLVVNADSKATEPKDLKGACVAVPKGSKAHCEMWLQRVRGGVPAGDSCPVKAGDVTPEEALTAVALGQSEAALVDVSSLLALQKNLPAAFKKLRVLDKSTELPSAVIVFRKDALDAVTLARVRTGLIDCVNTPIGKLLATFWQLRGFRDVTPEYNKLLADSLKAYPPPDAKPVPDTQADGPK